MKALHITFRYGKNVYGGAELYFRHLSEELSKHGVEVDICTTKTKTLTPFIKSGTAFDNTLENETINGIKVFRFPVKPQNRYLSFIFERLIQRQLDREELGSSQEIRKIITSSYIENGGILADGWNQLERNGDFSMRWTKSDAAIVINDSKISEINFSMNNPKKILTHIELTSNGYSDHRDIKNISQWSNLSFSLPDISGQVLIKIQCKKVWHPLKDFRSLGVGISNISYKTPNGIKSIDLEPDYRSFLIRQKKFIPYLIHHAQNRPIYYSWMFDYLRGPQSPEMVQWLEKNILNYDIVLAQMFPFNTIKYSLISKKYDKPLILLPLMHVEDEFYHWRHYYDLLKTADNVFALTSYSKKHVFDVLGSTCYEVGAGIDTEIFLNKTVDGATFRKKYHLEDKKIILSVSRKSPQKHYEYIIQVMGTIQQDFPDAIFVLIGPDEDKKIIDSKYVRYLGKMSDEDLADAYDACNLFVMMSESESFGMVFCEAWSRKKPVIGNRNCGAVASLIDDEWNGLLCSNLKELQIAIKRLLGDEMYAATLGENGYEKVVENYTWDNVANHALSCYKDLLR